MDVREARAFVTVCDLLSYRAAAARLHVSASTISETVSKLESRLECQLFDRTTRSVAMTRSAHRLLPAARRLLDAELDVQRIASEERDGPSALEIGTMYGLGADDVRAVADRVGVDVTIRTFELREPACGLDDIGAVDAAIVAGPLSIDDELTRVPIWTERRVVPVTADHPFASRKTVTVADVDEIGWVAVEVNDPVWQQHWRLDVQRGGPPREHGPAESSGMGIADAAVSGRALVITIESFERVFAWASLTSVPVSDAPDVQVDLAWRRDERPGRRLELAEAIREHRGSFRPGGDRGGT